MPCLRSYKARGSVQVRRGNGAARGRVMVETPIMTTSAEILRAVAKAIQETVEEAAPDGAPCGVIYMAMLGFSPTLTAESFNKPIAAMERAGMVRREGHQLFKVEA